ncbi:MAG: hypothetical protein ACP5XB_21620 [Isosphaeraceae bacterium]
MPVRFVLDKNLRGPVWDAVAVANGMTEEPIEITRVGDSPELPLGSQDPAILLWAERNGFIRVSTDIHTMPIYLAQHLQAGNQSPGIFLVRLPCPVRELVEWLFVLADDRDADYWRDRIFYLP